MLGLSRLVLHHGGFRTPKKQMPTGFLPEGEPKRPRLAYHVSNKPTTWQKLAKAEDLIDLFPHGSYIGWSGFTGVGYPKYFNWLASYLQHAN